jgi:hypothetical protein
MALVTTFDGGRKFINHYTIAAADAATAQTLTITVSGLGKSANNQACSHLTLNKIWFNVFMTANADAVEFQWDATSQIPFLIVNGYGDYDFSSTGGLTPTVANKAAGGYDGNVTIVNPARTGGDTVYVQMEWLKHYVAISS